MSVKKTEYTYGTYRMSVAVLEAWHRKSFASVFKEDPSRILQP